MNDNIRNAVASVEKHLARIKAQTERGIDLEDSPVRGLSKQLDELAGEIERQAVEVCEIGKRETIPVSIDDGAMFDSLKVDGEMGNLQIVTRSTPEPEALIAFTVVVDGKRVRVSASTTVKALQRVARRITEAHGDRLNKPSLPDPVPFEGLVRRKLR